MKLRHALRGTAAGLLLAVCLTTPTLALTGVVDVGGSVCARPRAPAPPSSISCQAANRSRSWTPRRTGGTASGSAA